MIYQRDFRWLILLAKATVAAALVWLGGGCKETDRLYEEESDGEVIPKSTGRVEFYADDSIHIRGNADFYFRVFDKSFTAKLGELPKRGEVPDNKKPYSGSWYPEVNGGTNVVMSAGKSPLAKYDDAFHGGRPQAVTWERQKHNALDVSEENKGWTGHCNGFSAAAQRHIEPRNSVTKNGVVFSPMDIKALLAEIYMGANFVFLGGQRCEDYVSSPHPDQRSDPRVLSECEDVNPGTLHVAVTNWIGRMGHTLIMDMNQQYQVWNFPFYRYEITSLEENLSEAQALRRIGSRRSGYAFNPNAVSFAYVRMHLGYAKALGREVLGRLDTDFFDLEYILELDGKGEIIGGEWIGNSTRNHPDFIWVALEPLQSNGNRKLNNPYVDHREVIRLWAQSVGYDPDNPPLDISMPVVQDDWGKWSKFEVTLDGNSRGAVFSGKPIVMEIKRKDSLADADTVVEVSLNGLDLATLSGEQGQDLIHEFEPGIGLNRLYFAWKKAGEDLIGEYLRFHVVR